MRHLRMVGLCLAAVFAVSAIAATSASALPEWGKCEKVESKEGKWTGPNCTVNPEVPEGKAKKVEAKFTGDYEWTKGAELANVPFSGESVGGGGVLVSGFLECSSGTYAQKRVSTAKCEEGGGEILKLEFELSVECEKENNIGEASGKNLILNVSVTFTGCKAFGFAPCNGPGEEEEEITTHALKGKLGYISKPAKEVGVLLEPAKKHGRFADFECPGLSLNTAVGVGNLKEGAFYAPEKTGGYDGIISPITPVNTMTSEYTQVYTVEKGESPKNIPSKFEGKHIELLEDFLYNPGGEENSTGMWSPSGEEITNTNTASEPGEIKA